MRNGISAYSLNGVATEINNGTANNKSEQSPVLITGGAGFIGTNVAHRILTAGRRVIIFDNLSRTGVERNLQWLRETHGDLVEVVIADIRDAAAVRAVVRQVGQIFHFAAQVAVTTSLIDPIHDFEINARGTLNVLEAMREQKETGKKVPSLVFTSTNKVYGGLEDLELQLQGDRYEPTLEQIRLNGVSEARPLDFHSPYGCSKGAADQYVFDYARTFNLPAIVFRMSCIYGPHQFGTEDQGWVAHFLIRALAGEEITIYGDGKQVRDILFVEDLVDAFLLAQKNMQTLSGSAFNIGGSPANTVSLLELIADISELMDEKVNVDFEDWRPGDQRYYVTDIGKFKAATGWSPRVNAHEGVARLHDWLQENATGSALCHNVMTSVVVE